MTLAIVPASVTLGQLATPKADYFSDSGCSYPWYCHATSPSAFYDSVGNKTWVFWETYLNDNTTNGRAVAVRVYSHTTNQWGRVYIVATNELIGDDHGVPSAVMDANGKVHVFYGSHFSPGRYARSNNARDETAWTVQSSIGGTLSYPHPIIIGSAIYIFYRYDNPLSDRPLLVYAGTVAGDGSITITPKILADYGADSRWYQGNDVVRGTDIHKISTRAPADDSFRRDIYYLIYDTLTGTIYNWNRSVSVVAASQPIDRTTLDASFLIFSSGTNEGTLPCLCFDAANTAHVAYMDGTSSFYTCYHMSNNGSGWSAPTTVGLFPTSYLVTPDLHRYDECTVIPSLDGGVDVYWVSQSVPIFDREGALYVRHRFPNGTWGTAALVRQASTFRGLGMPQPVWNRHPDLRIVFGEATRLTQQVIGTLKCYAYGDSGYVQS